MNRLFEKFVLQYYRRHYQGVLKANASQIEWNLSGERDEMMIVFLPEMHTDITLVKGEKTLIIDTKYYEKTMQTHFDKKSLHSSNVYQIFTYVKNMDRDDTGNVSGLLLYAKTGEEITPDFSYFMGKNRIGAKTLDLNVDFKLIAKQLDEIVSDYL